MQVAQIDPTTVLKKNKKKFFNKLMLFFSACCDKKKKLGKKLELGIFEIHSKIGQLENSFRRKITGKTDENCTKTPEITFT